MHREVPYTEFLERRFDFAAWKGAARERHDCGTVSAFNGAELPGWTLQRTFCCAQPDGPRIARGFWAAAHDAACVIDVEVFECAGSREARAWLLTLLGDMQGAAVERETAESLGDVAFRVDGARGVAFARDNLVIRIRNTGDALADGVDVARLLDASLTGQSGQALGDSALAH